MSIRKHLTRGRIEFGGVALAIVLGGGLALGVAGTAPSDTSAAAIKGTPYFDRGWEVDNGPARATNTGVPTWDHGWEVDNETKTAGNGSR